ncbi:tetratricopeptide repeat protein [Janthinobacterium sp. LB3P118]|uniref:tetratricopeptide repeat protein n=1 Tax=Janthinobacterium sp. LB3P118 TaxID=3424195 RepID=UPI003F219C12
MTVSTASFNEAGILAYNDGNYAEAFQQFAAAAAAGDPAGQHLLASLYYQGHGVTQDVPKAVELFTAAAQAGFPPSLANLALMYASGDGVAQDMAQSLAYGRQAAEAGSAQSVKNRDQLLEILTPSQQQAARALAAEYAAQYGTDPH